MKRSSDTDLSESNGLTKKQKFTRNLSIVRPFASSANYQRIASNSEEKRMSYLDTEPEKVEHINVGDLKNLTSGSLNSQSSHETIGTTDNFNKIFSEMLLHVLKLESGQCPTKYVKALINAGADPNFRNEDGCNALTFLIRSHLSNSVEIMQTIIDAGADPDALDPNGWTAAMRAVIFNCPEELNILINAGANVFVTKHGTDVYKLSREYVNSAVTKVLTDYLYSM
jgi:ankyrin repeat protein